MIEIVFRSGSRYVGRVSIPEVDCSSTASRFRAFSTVAAAHRTWLSGAVPDVSNSQSNYKLTVWWRKETKERNITYTIKMKTDWHKQKIKPVRNIGPSCNIIIQKITDGEINSLTNNYVGL